jgi:hypothetical protein
MDGLSDALMEECVRMMQQNLRSAPTIKQRAKSVKAQRNLGTIKDRKREKRKETESSNGEIIMRILRMRYVLTFSIFVYSDSSMYIILDVTCRPRTSEFIQQQMAIMSAVKNEQEARAKRRLSHTGHVSRPLRSPITPIPTIPE